MDSLIAPACPQRKNFGHSPAFAIIHGTAALMKDSLLQAVGAIIAPTGDCKERIFESTLVITVRKQQRKTKVNVQTQNRGKKPPHTTTQLELPERKERERLRGARRRAEKKETGQCSRCTAPAVPERSQCQGCAAKNRDRMNASNTKKRADKKAPTRAAALP